MAILSIFKHALMIRFFVFVMMLLVDFVDTASRKQIIKEERKMENQKCISITIRKGIWDAFNEIGTQKKIDTVDLIEEILIDYIVNNLHNYRRFPDLIDDEDRIMPRPPC